MKGHIIKVTNEVKNQIPLIHCITNTISVNQCANALLSVGAKPIMAEHPKEVAEITSTAKTVAQAIEAYNNGADYLGVGAIYPTTTKVKTILTSTYTLAVICKVVPIPVNAIGGLNKYNICVLKDIDIAGICVVSAVMKAENPKIAVEELIERRKGI